MNTILISTMISVCAYTTHAFTSQVGRRLSRKPAPRGFSATKRSFGLHAQESNENLWSVDECIDAYTASKGDVVFVDASYFHKGGRNGRKEFEQGPRIPGSQFLDLEDIVTSKELHPDLNPKNLYAMFPPPSLFAATMDAMNITPETQVIIYGRQGCYFTPRAWYLIRTYGAPGQRVGLMQGGLNEWIEQGGPVNEDPMEYNLWAKDLSSKTEYAVYPVASDAKDRLVDLPDVLKMIEVNTSNDTDDSDKTTIVDTRGSSFSAKGHMPGAVHAPYSSFTEPENTLKLKSKKELIELLESKGIGKPEDSTKVLLTCGSCVSVCHVALAMEECGYGKPLLYDGSWNEYGKDPSTPKVVPAK